MTTPTRPLREDRIGARIQCATCGLTKAPRGRSAPPQIFCTWDVCSGYDSAPYPDPALWPGESEVEFGYPAGTACDCAASGNPNKPKQHGADPHAKNCAVYIHR